MGFLVRDRNRNFLAVVRSFSRDAALSYQIISGLVIPWITTLSATTESVIPTMAFILVRKARFRQPVVQHPIPY